MANPTYTDIDIRGVTYRDSKAAAAALGVSASQVRRACQNGRLDAVGTGKGHRSVTIRGVTYLNMSAAGRALGVSPNTVRAALRKGTLHRAGTGRVGPEPMRVRIAGQVFENAADAAAHFGVKVMTVYSAISDGDPDRIARPKVYNPWKSQPFKVGPLNFPSMREASRALGFSNPEFISKVVKHNSKKGRERIIGAALRYVDKVGVSAP